MNCRSTFYTYQTLVYHHLVSTALLSYVQLFFFSKLCVFTTIRLSLKPVISLDEYSVNVIVFLFI